MRWVFVLLPCTPGLILLLAGVAVVGGLPSSEAAERDQRAVRRAEQLFMAGGAVLLAGLGIGGFVAWRIAHPRPDPVEEDDRTHPPTE